VLYVRACDNLVGSCLLVCWLMVERASCSTQLIEAARICLELKPYTTCRKAELNRGCVAAEKVLEARNLL